MNSAKILAYDAISRVNHWIIALAMIGMLAAGLIIGNVELSKEIRGPLIGLHKTIGVVVLLYGAWRIFWRLYQGFPEPVAALPAWQERAARMAHYGLLLGILMMPISGLIGSLFSGRHVNLFGVFTLPAIGDIKVVAAIGSNLHWIIGYLLIVLVILHIAAALKHHFVDGDATLTRMLRSPSTSDMG